MEGPTLRVTIEIPTADNGAVFQPSTEERIARATRAFLACFALDGANFNEHRCEWSAEYVYPRWETEPRIVGDLTVAAR
jgi:hypothetical protein